MTSTRSSKFDSTADYPDEVEPDSGSNNGELWKVFGRDTEAGKVLASLYKTGKPASISYPKPKQKKWDPKEMTEATRTIKSCPQKTKIEYPKEEPKVKAPKISAVDLIPHRKAYTDIQKEMDEYYSKPDIPLNKGVNRGELVNSLQNKFKKGRGALPKGAELPVVEGANLEQTEEEAEEIKRRALAKLPQAKNMFTEKRGKAEEIDPKKDKNRAKSEIDNELDELYNQIEEEIIERQNYLEEIDHLDEPKMKEKVKAEIVTRVAELQKIIKMMNSK